MKKSFKMLPLVTIILFSFMSLQGMKQRFQKNPPKNENNVFLDPIESNGQQLYYMSKQETLKNRGKKNQATRRRGKKQTYRRS